MPKLLWLGAVVDEATMLAWHGVSPAANRWQLGLVSALRSQGAEVELAGYMPAPAWPRGPLFVGARDGATAARAHGTLFGYANLPAVRHGALALKTLRTLNRAVRSGVPPGALITYNLPPATIAVGIAGQRAGIPWIAIRADAEYERLEGWLPPTLRPQRLPDAVVHLSWAGYEADPNPTKLHLDGGTDEFRASRGGSTRPCVVYTGALNVYGGADLLAAAWPRVQTSQARLVVCGPGKHRGLELLAQRDPRVELMGLVGESQLARIMREATVLLNPRPSYLEASAHNFPSKIPEYLARGVPVVSTWTPGLHPRYSEVLQLADDAPESFAAAIDTALGWSLSERTDYSDRARAFVETHLLWSVQATRFCAFVSEVLAHQWP